MRVTGPTLPSAACRSPPPRRAATSRARRWSAGRSVRRPGQPHSTTTVSAPARGEGGLHVGLSVRVAHLDHQRSVRKVGRPRRDDDVGRQPPGRGADRDGAGRVDPHDARPGQRGQRAGHGHGSRRTRGHHPIRLRLVAGIHTSPRRRIAQALATALGRLGQARLGEPAGPDGVDERGLDRRAPARPSCRPRCTAGPHRPRSTAPRPRGCRGPRTRRPCRARR